MIENLVQGTCYHLEFISPYTHKGPFDVQVSAIVRKATLSVYGDFDIRGTFFDEVGIKTYLEMVNDETDIYVCHPITNKDPLEINLEDFVFIPKSLIDFNKIDTFRTVTRIQINIEGVRRSFKDVIEYNEFMDRLETSIPEVLKKETILANDILSLSTSETELVVRNSEYKKEEENRESYIEMRQNEVTRKLNKEAERETAYYERLAILQKREQRVENVEKTYSDTLKVAESTKQLANKYMANVNELMSKIKDMYQLVINNASITAIAVPSWDELQAMVYKRADGSGDGIDPEQWSRDLELMKNNILPENWENVELGTCPLCGTDLNEALDPNKLPEL